MFLVVFRNRKRADIDAAAYAADNARMEQLGKAMPGFLSIKSFFADDGELVTISEWESEAHAKAWGRHPEHAVVQARGKADYYQDYALYTCAAPVIRQFRRTAE
jgi:heme-degrading monooxygenase HmoA